MGVGHSLTDYIRVVRAEEHNLKGISVDIPRDQLVVVTGPSGSGKSTLVFDTVFAEGQRRYVESLSAYARRFLGRLDKPRVEKITGLPPAVSIEQRGPSKNPRSTVATSTEIHDYLRLLYANIGVLHCLQCGRPIEHLTAESAARLLLEENGGEHVLVLAPVVRGQRGDHRDVLRRLLENGFVRVRVDGRVADIETLSLDAAATHDIDVVVDRVVLGHGQRERLVGALETALETGDGAAVVAREGAPDLFFAEELMCPQCGTRYERLDPKAFSYNRPSGACPECNGLGVILDIDPELVVPDKTLSLREGALRPWRNVSDNWQGRFLEALAHAAGFSLDTPWEELSEEAVSVLLWGQPEYTVSFEYEDERYRGGRERIAVTRRWEGMIPRLRRHMQETSSERYRQHIASQYARRLPCRACGGRKLLPESLAVTVGGKAIDEVSAMTIEEALRFFEGLGLSERDEKIARLVLREIVSRLRFIVSVGLEYLTLDRLSMTLSGGEAQRIRLATQIGSALTGVLYCLDEPSIGLHPRDVQRLIDTFYRLRDLGNTVVVIEHDRDIISAADHIIDLGPGAGVHGGQVVAQGPPEEVLSHPVSLTAQYLAGERQIPVPEHRRVPDGRKIVLRGARLHNLKEITVEFPVGLSICVTGVSGSGKSSLVYETLYKALARHLRGTGPLPGPHDGIDGADHIDRVVLVDQSPIGRTPRSNPATYTKTFDEIRALFAKMPEAKRRGFGPGRFSFNTREGRCEKCRGSGLLRIEMHFMSDVYITCDVCHGRRFDRETLEVEYKGKNITEVLSMTIEEALEFFRDIPKVASRLQTLVDVGLGYLQLGQPATTLSGGEAQRMKLAAELARRSTGNTLYILDEPTTGLSASDVAVLLRVLNRLVDAGNTVIVIEHNLEVIKTADWIVDLGPEGGDRGGEVVVCGTPEEVCACPASYTGQHLARVLHGTHVAHAALEGQTDSGH